MKSTLLLRRLHLWLGCLFAPLLMYFAISGAWQVLEWGETKEGKANVFAQLSRPHKMQMLPGVPKSPENQSHLFQYFSVIMAVGFVVMAGLGIWMAFKTIRPRWAVIVALALGLAIPLAMLWSAVTKWETPG